MCILYIGKEVEWKIFYDYSCLAKIYEFEEKKLQKLVCHKILYDSV